MGSSAGPIAKSMKTTPRTPELKQNVTEDVAASEDVDRAPAGDDAAAAAKSNSLG